METKKGKIKRYWIYEAEGPWIQVTKEEFIEIELKAGMRADIGEQAVTKEAFSSFKGGGSGRGIKGRVTIGIISEKNFGWYPEFIRDTTAALIK